MSLYYSFIIPVYNRPEEIRELLESFLLLENQEIHYEIIVVEDGSTLSSKNTVKEFKEKLPLFYYYKENSGPGDSRNYGMKRAKGNYFIILDSDVLLPSDYLKNIHAFLKDSYTDCFGGADAAHPSFTAIQKAINFAMTSFLTTGGIRGNEKAIEKFKPRSFNMGISKKAYETTGGFGKMRVGEDLDLSIRLQAAGFNTAFIPNATVYHKRRNTWKTFYKQVSNFGKGRPALNKWYPQTFSVLFWLPSLYFIGILISLSLILFKVYIFIVLYLIYFLLIFLSSSYIYNNLNVGIYSILAANLQLIGYGLGFLKATYYINLRKREPRDVFPELFIE